MTRTLGTCYYPEHWPREVWESDAARMVAAGLTWVRIGEFSWSRLEPTPGKLDWDWLDEAIRVLGEAGLKVLLGTPTATPPRWMLDRHPDMLAWDKEGRPRKFGSRRHYCFSHQGYRAECARIVTEMARRYGTNAHVQAWQTDNEYGCHDTTLSYSPAALAEFRNWLSQRYQSIEALNRAWGNVFWSMDYADFDDIELPNLTVTEPNPSHMLAFRRFSSDQVVAFNRSQTEILRRYSKAPISHNFMGRITDFDHFKVGQDLDFATWDSYPLGFLEDRVGASEAHKAAFMRQGDPDFQAFHHDLYRAVGQGRWWVMEQQPGSVNWAKYNPAPLPGMVRLWTWEAFAHGAEAVCYFRWRQAPFAQEQMHSGLLRPDSEDAPAMAEVLRVAQEISEAPELGESAAKVALVFDYDADFGWATQPHGHDLSYFALVFDFYKALRRLGISVDIIGPKVGDLGRYAVVLAPGMLHIPESLGERFKSFSGQLILGPRTGAKTAEMQIPVPLPPVIPGLKATTIFAETLHVDRPVALKAGGSFIGYREQIETRAEVIEETLDGDPAVIFAKTLTYIAGWPNQDALVRILKRACTTAGLSVEELPEALRIRETATERFWFNYGSAEVTYQNRRFAPVSVTRDEI